MRSRMLRIGAALLVATLAACGGGGGSSEQGTNSGGSSEQGTVSTTTNSVVQLLVFAPSDTTGTIGVNSRVSSPFGIASVSGTFDGRDIGTLTAPNSCLRGCAGTLDLYGFWIDATQAGSGPHTMVVTAVDREGNTAQRSMAIPISNAPAITLTSLVNGAIVSGTLQVAGSATSDKPGVTLSIDAFLANTRILTGAASSFSTSFDLAGTPASPYTLAVIATDSTGQSRRMEYSLIVASDPALVYAPLFSLPPFDPSQTGDGGRLLAAEGTKVLYDDGEGHVILRDVNTGAEVVLAAADLENAHDWQLSGGRIYAYAMGADCEWHCVYQWTPDGARTNLSASSPFLPSAVSRNGRTSDVEPTARDGHVAWKNTLVANPDDTIRMGGFVVYNVATGAYTMIGVPADARYVIDGDYAVIGGVIHFYFSAATSADSSTFDVYLWRSDTQATSRITQGSEQNSRVQTDGVRVTWQRSTLTSTLPPPKTFSLVTMPFSGGPASVVSTNTTGSILKDGALAWAEGDTPKTVEASTTGAAVTLATPTGSLLANGGGHVIYGSAGKMFSWSSATGTSTLRLDAIPDNVLVGGGALWFTNGQAVYRVPL